MERETLTTRLPESALLDSSVVLKWFRRDEVWRDVALQLRQAYIEGRMVIYVPDLLTYEIANVLRYKPDLSQGQVQAALNSLYDMQIRIVKGSREVVKEAIHLAYFYDVTVYDAAFLAIAENLSVPFITADDKLSQKLAKASNVHHISVFA
jgi:predicted nucleic acid-binding protein